MKFFFWQKVFFSPKSHRMTTSGGVREFSRKINVVSQTITLSSGQMITSTLSFGQMITSTLLSGQIITSTLFSVQMLKSKFNVNHYVAMLSSSCTITSTSSSGRVLTDVVVNFSQGGDIVITCSIINCWMKTWPEYSIWSHHLAR